MREPPDLPGTLSWERRTLVFADLAQSVRLMNADQSAAIVRWLRFVGCVQSDVLPALGGRLVKSHGDALLLEFSSVTSGVAAAFALLDQIRRANALSPTETAMGLRIGVHAADVVVQALDVYGAGVNLAARLATLADRDEIVVSSQVRDELSDMPGWHLVDMGPCFLKHFDQPVRAWRVCAGAARRTPPIDLLDPRPALAVIPFQQRAQNGASGALGDAIADDVIAALSRHRELRVISRLSTAPLRTGLADATAVGTLLHATYMLSGSYHCDGDKVEVTAQLAETRGGTVLWSDRLQARIGDIFHGQDALVPAIASGVGRHVLRCEVERARALPIASLDDYTLYIASIAMLHRLVASDFQRARQMLEHLVERNPRSAAPRAMLAKWHVLEVAQGWAADRTRSGQQAQAQAQRALDLDPEQALALAMQAAAVGLTGRDLDSARLLAEQATEANPQEPHAWLSLGAVHSWLGNAAEAERWPLAAVALSPVDPGRFLFEMYVCAGKLAVGRYDEAVDAARESIRLNAVHAPSHRLLTMALVLAGHTAEGRQSAQRLLRLDPGFGLGRYAHICAGRDRPHAGLRMQALREAGVPE